LAKTRSDLTPPHIGKHNADSSVLWVVELLEVMARMNGRLFEIGLIVSTVFAACGRGAPDTATPREGVVLAADSTSEVVSDSGPAAALLGDWVLQGVPPQRMPGLHITLTVDSVSGARYFGRLSNYFSGNVGQDPRAYEAYGDSVRAGGIVSFSLPRVDSDMLGMQMNGRLAVDTIALDIFVLGPDTISAGARRWILVRR
jgi:hypothetical protein